MDDSWEGHLRFWQTTWVMEEAGADQGVAQARRHSLGTSRHGALGNTGGGFTVCYCGRTFASKTALADHRVHAQGEHAPEWHMARDAVCGACLRSFGAMA